VPGENLLDTVGGVFGAHSNSDQARDLLSTTLSSFAWLSLIAAVLCMTWLRIPVAHRHSRSMSLTHEQEGDSLRQDQPLRSLHLYRSALRMTIDTDLEARLYAKITSLEGGRAVEPQDGKSTILTATTSPQVSTRDRQATDRKPAGGIVIADRYECLEEIGRGGSGVVHRALDRVLARELALKELPTMHAIHLRSAERFRQEARALARLNHPGIIQVHDLIEAEGRLWIAMELVSGGDLDTYLESHGPLSVAHACHLGELIADALFSAHEQGVIHRDLKPLNILMVNPDTPKITDFGLAKLNEGSAHTIEGLVMGSPYYMSPEQCEGAPTDHRSDIYSLGVILYEMLTGSVPFEGDARSILAQHIHKAPAPLSGSSVREGIPSSLNELVLRMLEKTPQDRLADLQEVRNSLEGLLSTRMV